MKSGASDPFADDPPEPPADEETESEPESTDATAVDEQPEPEPESESKSEVEPESTDDEAGGTSGLSKADLPLLLRRDTVKGERENVHQLFVQAETDSKARRAESDLSERLDTDVYRLDAREAIYLAGMQNLGDAEDILESWGYNF